MAFERRVRHYSPGPNDYVGEISTQAISGCWFELHRRGGCGAGELVLSHDFADRYQIEIGDWISFEPETGTRWYLGRVEEREARSPAGMVCRLTGMAVELGEIYPGGFSRTVAYKVPPHRFAQTDLFPGDPDYSEETVDVVSQAPELIWLLMQRYAAGNTHINFNPVNFAPQEIDSPVVSTKFRGEESLRSVIKDLALRNRDAAWGVDADGEFYFHPNGSTVQVTLREGENLVSLKEVRNLDQVYNRILLTGDYVYNAELNSEVPAVGFYRWRGTYVQPFSRSQYGDRRIRLWIPWIRSQTDAHQFVTEFFRVYANPSSRYEIEVSGLASMIFPWVGAIRLEDRAGNELITAAVETIRVQFDAVPQYEMSVGHEAPQELWPEPEHDERWELDGLGGGGVVTFSSEDSSSSDLGSSGGSSGDSSSSEDSSATLSSSGESTSLEGGSTSSDGYFSSSGDLSSNNSSGSGNLSESTSSGGTDNGLSSSADLSGSGGSTGGSGSDSWETSNNSSGLSSGGGWSSDASNDSSSGSGLCGTAIYDSFSDTDGTNLSSHSPGVAPSGSVWIDSGTNFQVYSNKARFTTIGVQSGNARISNGETNVVVTVSVVPGTLDFHGDPEWLGAVGIVLRATSNNDYYAVVVTDANVLLWKVTGGSLSVLDSDLHSLVPGEAFTITAECDGATISATVDGVTVSSNSVTSTTGVYGLYASNEDDALTPHEFDTFTVNCL